MLDSLSRFALCVRPCLVETQTWWQMTLQVILL